MTAHDDPGRRLSTRLDWIRRLARAQETKRAAQPTCPHDRGTGEFLHRHANGTDHVYRGCVTCHAPLEPGRWLPKSAAVDPDLPVALDDRHRTPPCVRCGAFGTELHHWAPRGLFGAAEADLWPTAWLCPPCHQLWHAVMAGDP